MTRRKHNGPNLVKSSTGGAVAMPEPPVALSPERERMVPPTSKDYPVMEFPVTCQYCGIQIYLAVNYVKHLERNHGVKQ